MIAPLLLAIAIFVFGLTVQAVISASLVLRLPQLTHRNSPGRAGILFQMP